MAKILIIDDDRMFCDVIARIIGHLGHEAICSLTLGKGRKEACERPYDVVLLDVQLPDGNGLEAIEEIKGSCGDPEVIIVTGMGNPEGADMAIRWGAWDYIEKPASLNEIIKPLVRTLAYRSSRTSAKEGPAFNRDRIIGDSPAMQRCLDWSANAAKSDVNVLLTGETGTGKEVFARMIHENSARASRPFVVVECSALPESLVESILFGHEKGSFTGADRRQAGLIELADGGTLFLDEVGELPHPLQKAFLRVLQERSFRPVGAMRERASNFRLIAATNRDLEEMVKEGKFRSDLLFRLRSMAIELPAPQRLFLQEAQARLD
ncbi:MAG: sigma-54 dependent transcriptional regulator, partial [Desulfobacteraceae bacterium]|nr:sigma-54 dependent transcriptional regulator [Desulfobacteraceae bacterium]